MRVTGWAWPSATTTTTDIPTCTAITSAPTSCTATTANGTFTDVDGPRRRRPGQLPGRGDQFPGHRRRWHARPVRLRLRRFHLREPPHGDRPRPGRLCRAAGLRSATQPPVPQRRRRHVHRHHGPVRDRSPRGIGHGHDLPGLRSGRADRHLRLQRPAVGFSVSQRGRRQVCRSRPAGGRGLQFRAACRPPAWAPTPATTTTTGGWIWW